MKFDKETVIGLVLCLLLMLAWPTISESLGWSAPAEAPAEETVQKPAAQPPAPAPAANTEAIQPAAADNTPALAKLEIPADGILRNDFINLTLSSENGSVKKISFPKYKNFDLSDDITLDARLFELSIPNAKVVSIEPMVNNDGTIISRRILEISGCKLQVEQRFSIKDDYIISCDYTLTNLSGTTLNIDKAIVYGGSIAPWHIGSGDKMRSISHRLDLMTAGGDVEDVDADDDDEDYYEFRDKSVKWASVSNKYFCSVLKSESGNYKLFQLDPREKVKDNKDKEYFIATIGAEVAPMSIKPNTAIELKFSNYIGPKSSDALEKFVDSGESVMHLAWGPINYLARFLMWVLNLLYSVCNSYGVSIIILTLLVRSAFYPLTSRGNESMRKMQKVQPLFKELKEKYKDDPQLLNQKMTELYRKEGINPLAGCLPILLQIPIFFALYAMLDNAIALRHVSFLWCKNLAAADTVCSIPLGFTVPWINISAIPINPLVLTMTILMVIQQRMTPMAADPAQKKMMAMMPIIMLLFLYDLPSGLTLYWTVSNFFSIIQLWLQKRRSQALQNADAQSK